MSLHNDIFTWKEKELICYNDDIGPYIDNGSYTAVYEDAHDSTKVILLTPEKYKAGTLSIQFGEDNVSVLDEVVKGFTTIRAPRLDFIWYNSNEWTEQDLAAVSEIGILTEKLPSYGNCSKYIDSLTTILNDPNQSELFFHIAESVLYHTQAMREVTNSEDIFAQDLHHGQFSIWPETDELFCVDGYISS